MKNRINIYCESAFWTDYFNDEQVALKDKNKRRSWDHFYDFLCKNNIFIDMAKSDIEEDTCGGKAIFDIMHATGGAGIHFMPGNLPIIELLTNENDDNLNSIFLTSKPNDECEKLSKSFGVIVMNKDMVYSASHLFKDCGQAFTPRSLPNWEYLNEYSRRIPSINYCNSLIIVDRYLFSTHNYNNVFDRNIKPIFNALLPERLDGDIEFNIIIVSNISDYGFYDGSDEIEQIIEEIRPNLRFSLNVIDTRKLHDRVIITNNVMLSCGAGFDVIGNNGFPIRFTTTSLTFPFMIGQDNSQTTYLSWIHTVLEQCKQNSCTPAETNHHLLNHYRKAL